MKRTLTTLSLIVLAVMGAFTFSSCDRKFDEPPVGELPNLTANATIAALLSRHTLGTPYQLIADSVIIEGTVIADDASGNFYKNIVIQDGTAGVTVRLDKTSLYNDFPIGRKVWVKCAGLFLGDYAGLPQLTGSAAGDAIAEDLIPQFVVGGARNQFVTPAVKDISQLNANDVNTLVRLDSVQFTSAWINGSTFAVGGSTPFSRNRAVQNCTGDSVLVRTSGYANFATAPIPAGKGNLIAVVGTYNGTPQLYLRNTAEANLTATRCGGGGGGGTCTNPTLVNISDVRSRYQGTDILINNCEQIRGIVISDRTTAHTNGRNLVIQDAAGGGIMVRFDASHSFSLGDEVAISINGGTLTTYNGLIQITMPLTNVLNGGQALSSGNAVAPRVATVSQVMANASAWESTLVQIADVVISGGTTLSGSRNVNDGTGTITMYTPSAATFASTPVTSNVVTITAIVGKFNTPQINIRNASDIQ